MPGRVVDDLHGLRIIGNIALHRMGRPSKRQLGLAVDVVEQVLEVLYELPIKSKRVKQIGKRLDERHPRKSGK